MNMWGDYEDIGLVGRYGVDVEKSFVEWRTSDIVFNHNGNLHIDAGVIVVGEHNTIVGGHLLFNMDSITDVDIKDRVPNSVFVKFITSSPCLNVAAFPMAEFKILRVDTIPYAHSGVPNVFVTGELTIKDITNLISFSAHMGILGSGTLVAQAYFEIDRNTWNIHYGPGLFFKLLGSLVSNNMIYLKVKIVAQINR